MRLAVAAVTCGLASLLAACGGGPSAPVGQTDAASPSSGGPFAPVTASGPFAPVAAPGPFAPVAASGPFAPVAAPGPFAPAGAAWVDTECPIVCGLAERLGCPIKNCLTVCAAVLAEVPAACQAAYGAYIECASTSGTCDQNGEVQTDACDNFGAAVSACVRSAQPNGPPNGPPDAAAYGGP